MYYIYSLYPSENVFLLCLVSLYPGSRMALTWYKRTLSISVGGKYIHVNLWTTHGDIHSYTFFLLPYEDMLLPAWPSG